MAALLWAVSGSAAKFLFGTGISPFELVQLRLTIAAAVLLIGFLIRRPAYIKIDPRDVAILLFWEAGPWRPCNLPICLPSAKSRWLPPFCCSILRGFIALYTVA
jgi:drug/metabolite transporter (DMT)-like permease